MNETRPPIPDGIQREVRQRCGFGCILCGAPLYEYHHIVPYNECREHVGANITLLCDAHHKEATNGLLTVEQIAQANQAPYNLQRGVSSPYGLHFQGTVFDCVIGGNRFSSKFRDNECDAVAIAVSVDDFDLVWFRIDNSGRLFFNATLFDQNNVPLLLIRENALVYRVDTWDLEFKTRTLTIREAARKILLEMEFLPPHEVVIHRARLLCNGVEILVRKSYVFVVNSGQLLVKCSSLDCDVGLQLGRNERRLAAGFGSAPDTLGRYHMPAAEVRRRQQEALSRMETTLAQLGIHFDNGTQGE
jgi:hypothetical protein